LQLLIDEHPGKAKEAIDGDAIGLVLGVELTRKPSTASFGTIGGAGRKHSPRFLARGK
jgi:hypothetical protein